MAGAGAVVTAAETQQKAQEGLALMFKQDMRPLWALLDLKHLAATLPTFINAVQQLLSVYSPASVEMAQTFYTTERAAAGVASLFEPITPAPLDPRRFEDSVRWATHSLWTADPLTVDTADVQKLTEGVAEKCLLDPTREVITESVKQDRYALAWARELESDRPCYFCAMLSTRGAAYKTEAGAEFKAHDHCRCIAVPVFTVYDPPERVREFERIYRDDSKITDRDKNTGNPKLNAFRRAYDAAYPLPAKQAD